MADLHPRVEQALIENEVEYTVHRHADLPTEIRSPNDFAQALGYDIARITKTLFLRSQDGSRYAALVCSMDRRVDFKAVARIVGARMEVASRDDLAARVGYPHNGVSPLGLDSDIQVLLDEGLRAQPTVLLGGGEVGVEVEVAPEDLRVASGGSFVPVTK